MPNKFLYVGAMLSLYSCVNNDAYKTKSRQLVAESKALKDSLKEDLIKEYTFEVPISKNCYLKDLTKDSFEFIDSVMVVIRNNGSHLLFGSISGTYCEYLACNEPYLKPISPKYFKLSDTVLVSGFKQYRHPEIKYTGYPFYLTSLKTKKRKLKR